ncbi:MAG: YkgJ family cysteine cluster protein [Desulfovibrio sp.]|uniref:YkgJ family cysteine cluster protein n=1 Tax=Desulfovibrio sp. 7SRBS1 TaxID=3378064 RepID=UPI003B42576E
MSDETISFSCQRCGHCCEGKGGIIMTEADIERMAKGLGQSREDFLRENTETANGRIRMRVGPDDYCLHYNHEIKGCGVHLIRPDICRAWPFFRGNLIDSVSWELSQDFCPGINPSCGHDVFRSQGMQYLKDENIGGPGGPDQPDLPNALVWPKD